MNYIMVLAISAASLALPIDEKVGSLHRRTNTVQQTMEKINYKSINPDENPILLSILLLSLILGKIASANIVVLLASIVIVNKLLEIERERPYDPELDFRISPTVGLAENKSGLWALTQISPSSNADRNFFPSYNSHDTIDQKKNLRKSFHSVLSRDTTDEKAEDAYNKLKKELVSDIEYKNRDSFVSEVHDDYSSASYVNDLDYYHMDTDQAIPNKSDKYSDNKFSDSKKRITTLSTFSVMTSDSLL